MTIATNNNQRTNAYETNYEVSKSNGSSDFVNIKSTSAPFSRIEEKNRPINSESTSNLINQHSSNTTNFDSSEKKLPGLKDSQAPVANQLFPGETSTSVIATHGKERTQDIARIISGTDDKDQQALNSDLLNTSNANTERKGEDRSVRVIGAGPTGQIQALKAYEQGLSVRVSEFREDFSRGYNIFQIKGDDFDSNVGKYLSEGTVKTLENEGVINRFEKNGESTLSIAINDLENILSGIVNAQSDLSDNKIQIHHKEGVSADQINSSEFNEDIIIAAVGSGKPRADLLQNVEGLEDVSIIDWQTNPRGFAIKLNGENIDKEFLNEIRESLTDKFPEANTLNFLSLPDQNKLQINIQLTESQFSEWVTASRDNPDGPLAWGDPKVRSSQVDLARELISIDTIDNPKVKEFLNEKINDENPNFDGWVNESSISRLTTPAVLLENNEKSIPLIFVGDSSANNWFLYGDGNPREHEQTDIVSNHLFKEKPENDQLENIINDINNDTVHSTLLDNTKIPGSYTDQPGLSKTTDNLDSSSLSESFLNELKAKGLPENLKV